MVNFARFKKLKYLIERESSMLTQDQAKALCNLYLGMIQRDLRVEGQKFFLDEFPECLKAGNEKALDSFIYHRTDEIIANARVGVSMFKIIGNQSYRSFLDSVSPLNGGPILEARENFNKACNHIGVTEENIEKLMAEYFHEVEAAGLAARNAVFEDLAKRYSNG